MKPFFIFLFLLFSATFSFAQTESVDTTTQQNDQSTVTTITKTVAADSALRAPIPSDLANEPMTYVFSLLPAAMFVVLMIIGLGALKKYNLREALTENDEAKITVVNPAYNPATLVQMAAKDATMIPSVLPATIEITNTFFRPDAMPAATVTVTENTAAPDANTGAVPLAPAPAALPASSDASTQQTDTATTIANTNAPTLTTDATAPITTDVNTANTDVSNVTTASIIPAEQKITSITPGAHVTNTKAMTAEEYAESMQKVKGNYRPSSSRLIAFFSSIITLTLATCLSCFFIYYYISFGKAPDLSGLSSVLIALGLGVVPYASNKIASAVTNKKPNNY